MNKIWSPVSTLKIVTGKQTKNGINKSLLNLTSLNTPLITVTKQKATYPSTYKKAGHSVK